MSGCRMASALGGGTSTRCEMGEGGVFEGEVDVGCV
jgi:hypothetical protein